MNQIYSVFMFDKKALTIENQIEQLQKRGLIITSKDKANHHLSHISYYRLGEYWHSMQYDKKQHLFKENSRFKDVISLYKFEAELRIFLFGIIEKIEISLRTKLIYHLSIEFDAWWFQNFDLFIDSKELVKTFANLEIELSRSKEISIKNHLKVHKDDLRFPPSLKSLEQTSFGSLSKLYGNLKNNITSKNIIAVEFGAINHTYLPSWLQSIAQIRNYCAQHARLWNKNLPGNPKLLSNTPYKWIENVPKQNEFQKLYIHLCLMKYILNIIQPQNNFKEELIGLFLKYPNIDPNALGMKLNWQQEKLWE